MPLAMGVCVTYVAFWENENGPTYNSNERQYWSPVFYSKHGRGRKRVIRLHCAVFDLNSHFTMPCLSYLVLMTQHCISLSSVSKSNTHVQNIYMCQEEAVFRFISAVEFQNLFYDQVCGRYLLLPSFLNIYRVVVG